MKYSEAFDRALDKRAAGAGVRFAPSGGGYYSYSTAARPPVVPTADLNMKIPAAAGPSSPIKVPEVPALTSTVSGKPVMTEILRRQDTVRANNATQRTAEAVASANSPDAYSPAPELIRQIVGAIPADMQKKLESVLPSDNEKQLRKKMRGKNGYPLGQYQRRNVFERFFDIHPLLNTHKLSPEAKLALFNARHKDMVNSEAAGKLMRDYMENGRFAGVPIVTPSSVGMTPEAFAANPQAGRAKIREGVIGALVSRGSNLVEPLNQAFDAVRAHTEDAANTGTRSLAVYNEALRSRRGGRTLSDVFDKDPNVQLWKKLIMKTYNVPGEVADWIMRWQAHFVDNGRTAPAAMQDMDA